MSIVFKCFLCVILVYTIDETYYMQYVNGCRDPEYSPVHMYSNVLHLAKSNIFYLK